MKNRKMGRKGVVFSNFIYLIMFYVIYFPMVAVVLYFNDVISETWPFSDYWADIPDSTFFLMDLILFVVVPLAALAYTIMSSRPQEQYIAYPG